MSSVFPGPFLLACSCAPGGPRRSAGQATTGQQVCYKAAHCATRLRSATSVPGHTALVHPTAQAQQSRVFHAFGKAQVKYSATGNSRGSREDRLGTNTLQAAGLGSQVASFLTPRSNRNRRQASQFQSQGTSANKSLRREAHPWDSLLSSSSCFPHSEGAGGVTTTPWDCILTGWLKWLWRLASRQLLGCVYESGIWRRQRPLANRSSQSLCLLLAPSISVLLRILYSAIRACPPANGRPESTGLHRFRRIAGLLSFKSSCNEGHSNGDLLGPWPIGHNRSEYALSLASSSIQAFATKVLTKGLKKSLAGSSPAI